MCQQYKQLSKTLAWDSGTLTLEQAGAKRVDSLQMSQLEAHHTNHQKACQVERPTKQPIQRSEKISKGKHVLACLLHA